LAYCQAAAIATPSLASLKFNMVYLSGVIKQVLKLILTAFKMSVDDGYAHSCVAEMDI